MRGGSRPGGGGLRPGRWRDERQREGGGGEGGGKCGGGMGGPRRMHGRQQWLRRRQTGVVHEDKCGRLRGPRGDTGCIAQAVARTTVALTTARFLTMAAAKVPDLGLLEHRRTDTQHVQLCNTGGCVRALHTSRFVGIAGGSRRPQTAAGRVTAARGPDWQPPARYLTGVGSSRQRGWLTRRCDAGGRCAAEPARILGRESRCRTLWNNKEYGDAKRGSRMRFAVHALSRFARRLGG